MAGLSTRKGICLLIVLCQVLRVYGSGEFFVGLLTYDNDIFRSCCRNYTCTDNKYCNLLFEITVNGLNGSSDELVWRSGVPLSPRDAVTFPEEKFTNPVHFDFFKWEGSANVTVNVYNKEGDTPELLVDTLQREFNYNTPSDYYIKYVLTSDTTNTNLSIVFRYKCLPTQGPSCFTDCMDHSDDEMCPMTSPAPNVSLITFPGFNQSCETLDGEGNVISRDCKNKTTATITTELPSTTTTTEEPTTETTAPDTTTTETNNNSNTTFLPSKTVTVTNSSHRTSDVPVTSPTTAKTTSTVKIGGVKTHEIRSTKEPTPTYTMPTTPEQRVEYVDNDSPIWPAIVGGVLGAIALFAAAGFICYFNRQKKLQKRQEIYNVNPKVLRNFEEYTENGTTGRADVPMETEQY